MNHELELLNEIKKMNIKSKNQNPLKNYDFHFDYKLFLFSGHEGKLQLFEKCKIIFLHTSRF